jgi:toxin CptA
MPSSSASSNCRLEWRPSRLRCACIAAMGGLAALAVALSAVPSGWGLLAGTLCVGAGLHRAWCEWHAPARWLVWPRDADAPLWLGAAGEEAWTDVKLRWRGPLATLSGRDRAGKLRRLSWWPDTLPPAARRALRLAADRRPGTAASTPMFSP